LVEKLGRIDQKTGCVGDLEKKVRSGFAKKRRGEKKKRKRHSLKKYRTMR